MTGESNSGKPILSQNISIEEEKQALDWFLKRTLNTGKVWSGPVMEYIMGNVNSRIPLTAKAIARFIALYHKQMKEKE